MVLEVACVGVCRRVSACVGVCRRVSGVCRRVSACASVCRRVHFSTTHFLAKIHEILPRLCLFTFECFGYNTERF